jgi:preprotein translocase subunit SecG
MSALYTFILVVQALVAAGLIAVILMQKSEGGGLGVGGSPAGFLSARGAADFLTRATAILATIFVALSITLAVLATVGHNSSQIDVDAANKLAVPPAGAPVGPAAPVGGAPVIGDVPLSGAPLTGTPAATTPAQPEGVPIQQ